MQGKATSVDHDNSFGITLEAVYRDDVLVTSESGSYAAFPRIYLETSPGRFEQVASLSTAAISESVDISGRTVAVVVRGLSPRGGMWRCNTCPRSCARPRRSQ